MKTYPDHINEIIAAYLSEELTPAEEGELNAWVAESQEHAEYFRRQQEIWISSLAAGDDNQYDKTKAFGLFLSRVRNHPSGLVVKRTFNHYVVRYVAVAMLFFTVGFAAFWIGRQSQDDLVSDMVVETPLGSSTKLFLPDGSQVWLNAGSRLVYSKNFGEKDRKIDFSGEAYFEVAHNKKLPFLVESDKLQVKVLGTKFNFCDYPDDSLAIVSLSEGKVVLFNRLNSLQVALEPNERVVYNKVDDEVLKESCNVSNALQWTNGFLLFDEELVPEIARKLERSFDVRIVIENDSLNSLRLYGHFVRREQGIHEILENLSATHKIKYSINGRLITLY